MDSENGRKLCFVCCKRVYPQNQPLRGEDVGDGGGSQSQSSSSFSSSSSSTIYLKFVEFAKAYLRLETSEVDRDQDDSSKAEVEVFCEACLAQVEQIFRLYELFCEVERRLSSKLVELGKLMKESLRHAATKDKTKPGIKELIASKCLEKDDMLATGSGEGRNLSSPEERFLAGDGDEDDYVGIDVDVNMEEVDSADEDIVEIESVNEEKTKIGSADELEVEGEELTAKKTNYPLSSVVFPKTISVMSGEDSNSIYVPDSQSECDDSDDDDSNRISIPDSQSECNDTDDDVNHRGNTERKRIILSDVVKLMSNQVNQENELLESQTPEASALQALIYDHRKVNISAAVPKCSSDNKESGEHDKPPDIVSSSNFVCDHCYKQYDTAQALYTHLLTHENQSTGQGTSCPFCYKEFVLPQTHELHMQIHHPSITATEKPFVCDGKRCTSAFKTLSELNVHISKHSEDILLECSVCQWGFIDSHHLKVHEILHTEPKNREYHCTACKCRFQRVMELQIHFNFKHGPSIGLQPMNEEVRVEEPRIVMKMKQICPHCKEDVPIQENLTLHSEKCILNPKNLVNYKSSAGDIRKKVRCHKCEKWITKFSIKSHLISHSFNEKLEKERVADEYSSSNSESSGDEEDIKEPDPNSTSSLTCSQCKREFPQAHGLHTHLLWHEKQSGEKGIPCCFCHKILVLPQTQKLHMEVKHPSIFTIEKPFVCDEKDCNSSFERLSELNEHVATHSKPISYCSFCQWGFVNPYRLKLHELFHTQRKQGYYYCPPCNHRVPSMKELQIHYDFRHGTKSGLVDLFECCTCSKRFFMKASLRKHILKKHKKKLTKKYQCLHCKLRFRLEKTLITHSETCLKNPKNCVFTKNLNGKLVKKVRCTTCGKFVRPLTMQKHLATHKEKYERQGERQRVTCEICGSSLSSYRGLQRHVDVIHKKIISKAQCEFCGKLYQRKSEMKKHVEVVHKGVDIKVICDVCGKVLANRVCYLSHLRNHKEGKRYACHLCDSKFWNNTELKKHLVRVHGKTVGEEFTPGEGLKFGCMFSSCGEKFGTDVELHQHVERDHAPVLDSKFMCTLCGKVFSNQPRLTRHNLVHSKEKRHECHVCKKRFAYNASLKDHLKIMHDLGEGQLYFRCEQPNCEAKFKLLKQLNKHVRDTHGGVGKGVANIKN